jgi:hypothetical protein
MPVQTPHLALFNAILQAALIVAVIAGAYMAARRKYRRHCLLLRITMGVQILSIIFLMLPSFWRYLRVLSDLRTVFVVEIIVHHVIGLVVIGLFVYVNLVMTNAVRSPRRLRPYMFAALGSWLVVLLLGIYLYLKIWRGLA